jgi:hypothetical protein
MAFPGTRPERTVPNRARRIRDELGKGQEILRQKSLQLVAETGSDQRAVVFIPDVAIKLVDVKLVFEELNIGGEGVGSFDLLAPAAYDEAAGDTNKLVNQMLGYDLDQYVVSTNMKVGAYTLAATGAGDGYAHPVVVSSSQVGGVDDTMGTIEVVGTDQYGHAQTESIIPLNGSAVLGVKNFLTITSLTGVGWVRNAGAGSEDTIVIGYFDPVNDQVVHAPLTLLAGNIPAMQPIIASFVVQGGGAGTVEIILSYILADGAHSFVSREG